jgi:hypothetical protein
VSFHDDVVEVPDRLVAEVPAPLALELRAEDERLIRSLSLRLGLAPGRVVRLALLSLASSPRLAP